MDRLTLDELFGLRSQTLWLFSMTNLSELRLATAHRTQLFQARTSGLFASQRHPSRCYVLHLDS